MSWTINPDRVVVERTIEAAAKQIEDMGGNEVYQQAWRKAARMLRNRKDRIVSELLAAAAALVVKR